MRLDKLLAHAGFGTRKIVKNVLKKEEVLVDGKRVRDGAFQVVSAKNIVTVNGEAVMYAEQLYYMLNKPQGVLSATEDKASKTVIDLLAENDKRQGLFPVGRLDKDTEGLLILTTDGQMAHELLSPKKHVAKVYFARTEGVVTAEDAAVFKMGVTFLDGYQAMPASLEIIRVHGGQSDVRVTIYEGKFHQVKKMFEAVGKKVVYLKREKMGDLTLDEQLALGAYRPLSDAELALLRGI
ncbi:16S rRNA pseudouridine(516) synthase [Listeria sp. ILCC792]|uniref:16S rRNA pseudouridine(516) synthase n=1 Tax=Listeria sp. ILCC792 TaxID=1918331 RepID=UPI000B588D28|nr:16S rRNA pseudouridine(516) synthase [Listeria sp. ILCC792]